MENIINNNNVTAEAVINNIQGNAENAVNDVEIENLMEKMKDKMQSIDALIESMLNNTSKKETLEKAESILKESIRAASSVAYQMMYPRGFTASSYQVKMGQTILSHLHVVTRVVNIAFGMNIPMPDEKGSGTIGVMVNDVSELRGEIHDLKYPEEYRKASNEAWKEAREKQKASLASLRPTK